MHLIVWTKRSRRNSLRGKPERDSIGREPGGIRGTRRGVSKSFTTLGAGGIARVPIDEEIALALVVDVAAASPGAEGGGHDLADAER
mmetsp:Transcript_96600/g.152836  ORF Transcript_96600/g.152836 Transcript_96600/m.152836 type:complete len:87 (+) Transcript_96600:323-583(+)